MRKVAVSRGLGALLIVATACSSTGPSGAPPDGREATVIEVVDGDTVRVRIDGVEERVRMIGIDTPEVEGPFTASECFGRRASAFSRSRLEGQEVVLETDVELRDRFGRLLAYVWVGGSLFNETILEEGYAVVATFPPNVRYVDRFRAAERRARAAGAGLWDACAS